MTTIQINDGNGSISLAELTRYVTEMSSYMRDELMEKNNQHALFEQMVVCAIEVDTEHTRVVELPISKDTPDGSAVRTLTTNKYNVRLEVASCALEVGEAVRSEQRDSTRTQREA